MHSTHDALKESLELALDRISILDIWAILNLPGTPGKSCSSPWRDDKHPSFSIFDDGRSFKDFATDEGGDAVAFLMAATGMSFKDSANWMREKAGISSPFNASPTFSPTPKRRTYQKPPQKPRKPPSLPELVDGTDELFKAVAESRGVLPDAVKVAHDSGCIKFGKVCGFDSWILTDRSGRCAEARRIDRLPFPASDTLAERKSHAIKGSQKSWPVGLIPDECFIFPHNGILLVEGGPDYLAAFHFICESSFSDSPEGMGFVPVAMLGRSQSIHPDALPMFKGRQVRIYPHQDKDGGGMEAAQRWAEDVHKAGADRIDFFTFDGIHKRDGSAATDLNDAANCHNDHTHKLTNILPILTTLKSCQ